MALVLTPLWAVAQRDTTRNALSRMEAALSVQINETGALTRKDILPTIVVSAEARYQETTAWYPTEAVGTVVRLWGPSSVRLCEACMAARLRVEPGRFEQNTAALSGPEIAAFDETIRGTAQGARTAIWVDETAQGVSVRILDLKNSRILYAENFDDHPREAKALAKNIALIKEQERRVRGDALSHTFVDVGVLPSQHIGIDWSEQWGDTNANLAGFSLTLLDPIVGVGGSYFRIIPEAFNITVGIKVLVSVPTAIARAVSPDLQGLIDPLLTAALVVRWPIFNSNFGIVGSVSTNGNVSFGVSLLNISFLPVLP